MIFFLLWNMLIFHFSNQSGMVSQNSSDHMLHFFGKLFPFIDINQGDSFFQIFSFFIRKSAHMFLFFILFFLTFSMLSFFLKKNTLQISFLLVFLRALLDEIHQLFIPGRSGELKDVFIDMFGAFLALLFLLFLKKRKKNFFLKNKKRGIN